jgi:hypothetical protein
MPFSVCLKPAVSFFPRPRLINGIPVLSAGIFNASDDGSSEHAISIFPSAILTILLQPAKSSQKCYRHPDNPYEAPVTMSKAEKQWLCPPQVGVENLLRGRLRSLGNWCHAFGSCYRNLDANKEFQRSCLPHHRILHSIELWARLVHPGQHLG